MEKISVITVCYNAEKVIKDALQSVLTQTYANLEYIIQDGGSIDGTTQIIQECIKEYSDREIIYESKKDAGIYNAMNLALEKATGDWCIFINADDTFFSSNVLAEVFDKGKCYDEYAAIFGGYRRHDAKNGYVFQSEKIDMMPKKMPFIHQSIFIRTDVMRKYKYNERYKLCADYNTFFNMYVDGCKFLQIDTIIADFSIDGASGSRNIEALKETIQIKKRYIDKYPISLMQRIGWRKSLVIMKLKQKIPNSIMIFLRKVKAYFRLKVLKKKTT